MQISVVNMAGDTVNEIELPASIFDAKINVGLMHQALVRQMANARVGTHKAKGRSEVNRSGAKIYRQKGTGNARHGSRRAPIFVGGGIVHGPFVRDYSKKMPRKMRHASLRSGLSVKAQNENVVVIDDLTMDRPKTKEMASLVKSLVGDSSALVLIGSQDSNVERSARNLPNVKALLAGYLNIRDLLGHDKLIMSLDALDVLIELLGRGEVFIADEETGVAVAAEESEE